MLKSVIFQLLELLLFCNIHHCKVWGNLRAALAMILKYVVNGDTVLMFVIVISKFLKRYSKAKRTRAPAYSRALRRNRGGFQRGVKRSSGPISRVPGGAE